MELCDKTVCTVCYYLLMACVALNQQGGKRFGLRHVVLCTFMVDLCWMGTIISVA